MAFSSVTLNDGSVDHVYDPVNVAGSRVIYRDTTTSTLALPQTCEISHSEGSPTRPDRHLLKLSLTDDNTDGDKIETVTAHAVVSLPRAIVTRAQAENLIAQLKDALASADIVDALLDGGFPTA